MGKRQPVYDLNDYILNGTEAGALLGWPNASGLRPIVPTQQQPEPNVRNEVSPYIVYSVRTTHDPVNWWINTDEVSYVIWGNSFEQLSEVANIIIDSCRAMDDSAGDIMRYLGSRGGPQEWAFHYIRLLSTLTPEPAAQEAGRMGWIITLRYEYSPLTGKHIS